MAIPDPGGAICTACGPTGSSAYNACNAQVAMGLIPPCAAPKSGQAAQQSGGSIVQPTQQQAAPTADPWYCFLVPAGVGGCSGSSGAASSLNWGDIGIRTGLIIFGVILVLLVIAKMIEQPSVIIEK